MAHLNRTIHLDGIEWNYRIGKYYVLIQEPYSTKKHTVHFRDIAPHKWEHYPSGGIYPEYCRPPELEITPADVRGYIEAVLIKKFTVK